jgi:hypothetical protein
MNALAASCFNFTVPMIVKQKSAHLVTVETAARALPKPWRFTPENIRYKYVSNYLCEIFFGDRVVN